MKTNKPTESGVDGGRHLFDRPRNVKWLLRGLYAVSVLLLLVDAGFLLFDWDKHAHYTWEEWPGFYAVYGFVSCVLLVWLAKHVLRPLVMRDEDYYD